MKKLFVISVAVAIVLMFAAPAFANVQSECGDPFNDVGPFTFRLPIVVEVNHAMWAEFRTAAVLEEGAQKESLTLGPICPEETATDQGWLFVKSNDDFSKTFAWGDLTWDAAASGDQGEVGPAIDADDLDVTVDGTPVDPGDSVNEDLGISAEHVEVGYTADWNHHAGVYTGEMTVSLMQE